MSFYHSSCNSLLKALIPPYYTLFFVSFVLLGILFASSFNIFNISFISVDMSGSPFNLDSDFESDASPVVRKRVSSGLNHPPFSHDRLDPKFISITNDSESERPSMGSSNEGVTVEDSSWFSSLPLWLLAFTPWNA